MSLEVKKKSSPGDDNKIRPRLVKGLAVPPPVKEKIRKFNSIDPRYFVAGILFTYLVLGVTFLGFNRSPEQMLLTTLATCAFEFILCYMINRKIIFPLSALITSFSLSLLLNYSHNNYILLIPVFFAIGSKYIFTLKGRHFYNPALAGITFSLIFFPKVITAAPAYQWNGIPNLSVFIVGLGLIFLLPRINRHWLVISFLATFTAQTFLRAVIMRYHLPFETLFLGTLTSPAFFLFAFFMITDPMTSPPDKKMQIKIGAAIATVDLLYHIHQSYFTFFFAAFTVASFRLIMGHIALIRQNGSLRNYLQGTFLKSSYYRRPLTLVTIALVGALFFQSQVYSNIAIPKLNWHFTELDPKVTSIDAHWGTVFDRTDPRIRHIQKWILTVSDGVAIGDVDNDGLMDLFFTNTLKEDGERCALYKNLGDFKFQRIPLPALDQISRDIEHHGLPSNAMFVDYDNDGYQDLFITYAFGSPRLLKNMMGVTGKLEFKDITREVGLEHFSNSVTANFADLDGDGLLDLILANAMPKNLPHYSSPHELNLFHLPQPEYAGDERMFDFMHSSWHLADNGGDVEVWYQTPEHKFLREDNEKLGITETRWSLAIGTADFNKDGRPDLYIANDFGPDELLYNEGNHHFMSIKGKMFGSIGRDTYKGMNASVADFDRNGWQDIYISNVHHELQAEGSLLWMFSKGTEGTPQIEDKATAYAALNEDRFGWGAAAADFDNDGWVDLAQANGMVDDSIDKKYEKCPDYWYVNEKVARSAPSIHRFADNWGDIRGMCIYGKEQNRLYLNVGPEKNAHFIDVADSVGLTEKTNSRGMASVDLNNSGHQDLITTHPFKGPSLFKNTVEGKFSRHWIGFNLVGDSKTCNRDAVGTSVEIRYPGQTMPQVTEVHVVNGFSAQSDRRVHFGLNDYQGPVDVSVNWCGSKQETKTYPKLSPDQYVTLKQGEN